MLEKSTAVSRGAAHRFTRGGSQLVVGLIVVALLFSGMALRDLNGLLQGMRTPDGAPHTIGGLASVTKSPGDSVEQAEVVIRDWYRHSAETPTLLPPEPVDARHVARWQIVVDGLFFAVAYAAAFLLFFRSTKRREDGAAATNNEVERNRRATVKRVATVGTWAVVLTFAADEVENVAEWLVIDGGWDQLGEQPPPDALALGPWGHLLWGAAALEMALPVPRRHPRRGRAPAHPAPGLAGEEQSRRRFRGAGARTRALAAPRPHRARRGAGRPSHRP